MRVINQLKEKTMNKIEIDNGILGSLDISDNVTEIFFVSRDDYEKECERQDIEPDDMYTFLEENDINFHINAKLNGIEGYVFFAAFSM